MKALYCLILSFFVALSSFAQKAYEKVYYTGKTDRYIITLIFAAGYLEASKVEIMVAKSKYKFTTDIDTDSINTSKNLRFNHFSSTGIKFSDYVLLNNINDNHTVLPEKIYGYYSFKDSKYKFTLKKK